MRDRAVWLMRVLWFVLPVTAGPLVRDALADDPDGRRLTLTIGAWVVWFVGMICVAMLLPLTLTGIRVLTPASVVAAVWSVVEMGISASAVIGLVSVASVTAVAFSALVGDRMVDGASYGDERRMLLRPPTGFVGLIVPPVWVIGVAGVVSGPALLGSGYWLAGALCVVVGLPLAAIALRALHQLSRRWAVFVPTGFVLHDLQVLTEPVLFRRTAIERLGPAIAGTPARDLTNRASGLLIECELTDAAPLGLRSFRGTDAAAELVDIRRFLFVPSRPGAFLDEAERRRIAVA